MTELRGDGDFALEPVGPDLDGQLWVQHLHRDRAVVLLVLGQVDRGHTAAAKLSLDAVAAGERGAKLFVRFHRGCPNGSSLAYSRHRSGATLLSMDQRTPQPVATMAPPPDAEERQRRLDRMKRTATGLLAIAAALVWRQREN